MCVSCCCCICIFLLIPYIYNKYRGTVIKPPHSMFIWLFSYTSFFYIFICTPYTRTSRQETPCETVMKSFPYQQKNRHISEYLKYFMQETKFSWWKYVEWGESDKGCIGLKLAKNSDSHLFVIGHHFTLPRVILQRLI